MAYAIGVLCFPRVPMPAIVRFGLGAAVESQIVFLLLLAGWANWIVFLGGGLIFIAATYWVRPKKWRWQPGALALDRLGFFLFPVVFTAYGVLYLIHALAPEIQPDAIGYHLGLASEYVRLGRFPPRIGFFEMAPQGLEMLFTVAFAFGRHSAAKLVHFAFLIATVPLLLAICRRLRLSDRISLAAALYFCAPVVGVSGTSAYNDAGFVFFVLAAFYLLLDRRWAAAGIAAGFCYGIKFPGLLIAPVAVIAALLLARRIRPPLTVAAAALAMIAPWMVRAAVFTHNPVAPLFNDAFPNPYFRAATDRRLNEVLTSYAGFSWKSAPLDYALRGNFHGTIGPVFLLLPLGLIALRHRNGRIVWLAALVLLIPWWWNVGTRFLMPALPFFALALAIALPKPLMWACLALQAVACWPSMMALYAAPSAWRLDGFPWRAALRLQPESDYLSRIGEYNVARMVEANTAPGDRIFALAGLANAYLAREAMGFWNSAQASEITDALIVATPRFRPPLATLQFEWSPALLRGIRFRMPESSRREWRLFEVSLFSNSDRVFNSPQWPVNAWPERWEAPLALDGSPATSWRTFRNAERGMFLELHFDRPQSLTRADLLGPETFPYLPIEVHGLQPDGRWRVLSDAPHTRPEPTLDLRRNAVQGMTRAGIRYVLVDAREGALAGIGEDMVAHGEAWGLADVAREGGAHLFRIQ